MACHCHHAQGGVVGDSQAFDDGIERLLRLSRRPDGQRGIGHRGPGTGVTFFGGAIGRGEAVDVGTQFGLKHVLPSDRQHFQNQHLPSQVVALQDLFDMVRCFVWQVTHACAGKQTFIHMNTAIGGFVNLGQQLGQTHAPCQFHAEAGKRQIGVVEQSDASCGLTVEPQRIADSDGVSRPVLGEDVFFLGPRCMMHLAQGDVDKGQTHLLWRNQLGHQTLQILKHGWPVVPGGLHQSIEFLIDCFEAAQAQARGQIASAPSVGPDGRGQLLLGQTRQRRRRNQPLWRNGRDACTIS